MLKAKQQGAFRGGLATSGPPTGLCSPWAKSMKNARFGWVVLCASVTMSGCRAPSPDWNGTWKLNPAKSSYQGQVLTISISAEGEYRFDESTSHTLLCDGRARPIGNNRTLVCVRSGDTALDIIEKENGAGGPSKLRLGGRPNTSPRRVAVILSSRRIRPENVWQFTTLSPPTELSSRRRRDPRLLFHARVTLGAMHDCGCFSCHIPSRPARAPPKPPGCGLPTTGATLNGIQTHLRSGSPAGWPTSRGEK